jgi:agmatinase
VSFNELSDALFKLSGLNIVGMDITELSPVYDQSGISTAAAVKVLRELLLLFSE